MIGAFGWATTAWFTKLPMKFGSCASTACGTAVKLIVEELDYSVHAAVWDMIQER